MWMCVMYWGKAHMWRSQDNFVESILTFYIFVGSETWTQVVKLSLLRQEVPLATDLSFWPRFGTDTFKCLL